MCPDFHTHSSVGMSRPQYFILKEDEEGGEGEEGEEEKGSKSKISSKDTSRNSDGLEEVAPKNISSSIPQNPLEEKKEFDADDDDDDDGSKSKISSKDTSRNSDGLEEVAPKNISSSIPQNPLEEKKEFDADDDDDDDDDDDKVDKCGETSVSSTESEKPCPLSVGASTAEVADDDEGFRTPTSPSHKIPVITRCPPAPKKTTQKSNPASIKRKGSPTATRRALHLDLSSEVESMFPPLIQDDDADGKTKKARRDHDHNSAE